MRIVHVRSPLTVELTEHVCFHCRCTVVPSLGDCFSTGKPADRDKSFFTCPMCDGRCIADTVSAVQRRIIVELTAVRAMIDKPSQRTPKLSNLQTRMMSELLEQRRAHKGKLSESENSLLRGMAPKARTQKPAKPKADKQPEKSPPPSPRRGNGEPKLAGVVPGPEVPWSDMTDDEDFPPMQAMNGHTPK